MSQMTYTLPSEGKNQRLRAEIAAFAEVHAGTDLDLDEDLERAGLEAIRNENFLHPWPPSSTSS